MLTREQISELAASLQGSGQSLDDVLDALWGLSEDDLDTEDTEALDLLVFECTTCNNWFEIGEMSDDSDHDWECEGCSLTGD